MVLLEKNRLLLSLFLQFLSPCLAHQHGVNQLLFSPFPNLLWLQMRKVFQDVLELFVVLRALKDLMLPARRRMRVLGALVELHEIELLLQSVVLLCDPYCLFLQSSDHLDDRLDVHLGLRNILEDRQLSHVLLDILDLALTLAHLQRRRGSPRFQRLKRKRLARLIFCAGLLLTLLGVLGTVF